MAIAMTGHSRAVMPTRRAVDDRSLLRFIMKHLSISVPVVIAWGGRFPMG